MQGSVVASLDVLNSVVEGLHVMELKVEELRTYPGLGSKDGMINWDEEVDVCKCRVEVGADDRVDLATHIQ